MPNKRTIKKAQQDKRMGKAPFTQAGEFVKEEIDDIRQGKHGARSAKQAIAIGLSKARQAGVDIPDKTGKKKVSATQKIAKKKVSPKKSQAAIERLKKEPQSSVSHHALSLQTHRAAEKRGPAKRHAAAMKAAKTRTHRSGR